MEKQDFQGVRVSRSDAIRDGIHFVSLDFSSVDQTKGDLSILVDQVAAVLHGFIKTAPVMVEMRSAFSWRPTRPGAFGRDGVIDPVDRLWFVEESNSRRHLGMALAIKAEYLYRFGHHIHLYTSGI